MKHVIFAAIAALMVPGCGADRPPLRHGTMNYLSVVLVLFFMSMSAARAQEPGVVYRCTDASGTVTYRNTAHSGCAPIAAYQRAPQYFHGSRCTQDCSGHEAGYAWAASRGVTSATQCGGRSISFINGCLIYLRERPQANRLAVALGRSCSSNSDKCQAVCEAGEQLQSAAQDLADCAGMQAYDDDCSMQFIDVASAHDEYESAVSDTDGDCH